jgi:hypothetical protein
MTRVGVFTRVGLSCPWPSQRRCLFRTMLHPYQKKKTVHKEDYAGTGTDVANEQVYPEGR